MIQKDIKSMSLGNKNRNMNLQDWYRNSNFLIIMMILLALAFPLIADYFNFNFFCQYKSLTGISCRSCGLTRGLRACLAGKFEVANELNVQSVFIFFTFLGQLVMRGLIILVGSFPRFLIADVLILLMLLVTNIIFYG